MNRSKTRRKNAIHELGQLMQELPRLVDVVVVEGFRDMQSLRSLGYRGSIEVINRSGVNDFDLADDLVSKYRRILLLLDFDEEGLRLNRHFNQILERKGAKVEYGLRQEFARLMSATGAYAIEDIDNILGKMEE
jgi:5S rRNA maturation endonuclease (ribonuclease M5)